MKPIKKHLLSILKWGVAVNIASFVCESLNVAILMALRSNSSPKLLSFLQSIWDISGYIYELIGFPVIWVKPQTIFCNVYWQILMIGLFWGLVISLIGSTLKFILYRFALWVYRLQNPWITTIDDTHLDD